MTHSESLIRMEPDVQAVIAEEIGALRVEIEKLFGKGTLEAIAIVAAFEDGVQAAVLRALESMQTMHQGVANRRAWVLTVAQNLRTDLVRRARREAAVIAHDDALIALAPAPQRSPETLAMLREACSLVAEAMACFDPITKRAFLLFHFDGLTYAEVGAMLGISEAAAKMRCLRAQERLMASVGDDVLDLLHSLRCRLPPMFFESRRAELRRAIGLQRTLEMTRRASSVFAAVLATALAFYRVEQIPLAQSGLQLPRVRIEAHTDNPAERDASPARAMTTKDMRSSVSVRGASTRSTDAHSAKSASMRDDDMLLEARPAEKMYTPSIR